MTKNATISPGVALINAVCGTAPWLSIAQPCGIEKWDVTDEGSEWHGNKPSETTVNRVNLCLRKDASKMGHFPLIRIVKISVKLPIKVENKDMARGNEEKNVPFQSL